jgi:hypothetical protein
MGGDAQIARVAEGKTKWFFSSKIRWQAMLMK